MIKVECGQKGISRMEVSGTTLDIASEAACVVREIYERLCEHDQEEGELFADYMKTVSRILFLPKDEMMAKLKESELEFNKRKALEEIGECLDELIRTLRDL